MLQCQLRAAELGYITSLPVSEVVYDILVDTNKKILKTQVKYCNRKKISENYLELRLSNPQSKRFFYLDTQIDMLLVFIPQKNTVLKYDPQIFHRRRTLQINLINKKSKWFYERYIWKG